MSMVWLHEDSAKMSRFNFSHIESFKEYQILPSELRSLVEVLGLKQCFLWDSKYWYVSHEDWGRIFDNVLMNMPKYVSEKFDCENYALLTTTRVSERYRLNTCGIVIGQSPMGYHGFNIFISEQGLYYLEPQTGDIFSISEDSGYKAEIIILG